MQDHDLDAELARFLGEVEGFLSPGRRTSAAIVEPVLVERCVAAREVLANLLSERLVAIDPSDPARPAASTVADEAACAALREACRRDLRNFHRLGAIAGLQVEPTASQPVILHGRFVPKAGAATEVLSGANRRTAAENVLAFPLLVDDGDRGQEIRLPGAFCCDAIELTDASSVATAVAGDRFHFVSDAGTSVEAPTLRVRVPVRALPRPPELLRVAAIALEGSDIAAAKSWRLECDYRCEALAQDTLRFDLASELPRVEATAAASPDLLDALVVFRAHLPAIAAVLERTQAAPAAIPDPIVSEAIRGFVMLVEEVARHFRVPAVPGLDAGAESEERREMTPEPGATLVAGPFDVTRRQQAGCSVQIVRNLAAGLSPAFHYPTPVVRAATPVRAFVDRTLDLDLATLPRLEVYMPDGPAPGSLVDCLTRLLRAVLDAPGERETLAPVTVSLRVEFACRPAGMGDDGPLIRLPVAVVSPRTISPVRRLLEMRAWAQPIAAHLEHLLAQNDPRTAGGFERAGARFLFDFMLGSVGLPGASGDPWLRWSGLYFRCADPA